MPLLMDFFFNRLILAAKSAAMTIPIGQNILG